MRSESVWRSGGYKAEVEEFEAIFGEALARQLNKSGETSNGQ